MSLSAVISQGKEVYFCFFYMAGSQTALALRLFFATLSSKLSTDINRPLGDELSVPYVLHKRLLKNLVLNLHMAALALELCCTLMADKRSGPNVSLTVRNKVLSQALTLIRSSLLQGQALLALQNFFGALVYSANTSFDVLLDSLLSTAKPSAQAGAIAK
ncbi:hypothetical protein ACS0TY_024943 [Phlomoides rotata]